MPIIAPCLGINICYNIMMSSSHRVLNTKCIDIQESDAAAAAAEPSANVSHSALAPKVQYRLMPR